VASRYDELDGSTELEQQLTVDLRSALAGRGCEVIHHGSNGGGLHSPGGKPDIEIRDEPNNRLILVEVTRRVASQAEGEFIAITDHLDRAVAAGGYSDYGVLYVSPRTSARLSSSFRDLCNRARERDRRPGRVLPLDFEAAELLTTKLAEAPSDLYPTERFGNLFSRWAEAGDDTQARLLVQQAIFPEDDDLAIDLRNEVDEHAADREKRLRKQLEKIEDDLRSRGVTGEAANVVVIYLTFLRLYEERRQRLTGERNRFTAEGFSQWASNAPAATKARYGDRMIEALLHEIAEDPDLKSAGLLRDGRGHPQPLHEKVRDRFVMQRVLPVFDDYDFHTGRVDVLGAVFETIARRAEKDTRVGQFFTPQPVVDFCTELVPLTARDLVLDPAVGTGRFLISAMEKMLDLSGEGSESRHEAEEAIRSRRLLGTDIGEWVATIAKMNMFIHGDGKTNIRGANGLTLGDTKVFDNFQHGLSGQVSVVLTNPPLGNTSHVAAAEDWQRLRPEGNQADWNILFDRLGVIPMRVVEEDKLRTAEATLEESDVEIAELEGALPDDEAFHRLPGARRRRDRRFTRVTELRAMLESGGGNRLPINEAMKGGALFLGAIADYLTPDRSPDLPAEWRGGWAAVVVDEAILNTTEYSSTRRFIQDRFYIKAVISLGRQAFEYLAHTSAKTSVLLLVKKPEPGKVQREPVFLAHAENVGYSATGVWIGNDLPSILVDYESAKRAILNAYRGSVVRTDDAIRAVESLAGFGRTFFWQDLGQSAGRLDYYYARFLQRTREMRAVYGTQTTLADYIEPAPLDHPQPNRRSEYSFAYPSRLSGTVVPKGLQVVGYSTSNLWVTREGDLVVSGIDAVNGAIGVSGPDVDGMVLSQEFFRYRAKSSDVSLLYLSLLLRGQRSRELLVGLASGTSNRTRLERTEQLLALPVPPLPPLEVQDQVAQAFADSVAARTAAERAQLEAERSADRLWRL
jgi:type I restriction-modification system DNA methylase subunit